jgi:hypothetical protein
MRTTFFRAGACVRWIGRSTVTDVEPTDLKDAPTQTSDVRVRLRVEVYDALAAAKGKRTVAAQALWHEVGRSTLFRLRAGEMPRTDTATRMAADLGVAFEVIWERA